MTPEQQAAVDALLRSEATPNASSAPAPAAASMTPEQTAAVEALQRSEFQPGGFSDYFLRQGVGQGAAFGFGDEIIAGARSLVPGSKSYRELLTEERARNQRVMDQNPAGAIGAQLAGGIAGAVALPGSLIARGAGALARGVGLGRVAEGVGAAGARLMPQSVAGRGAVIGGTGGALAGAGNAEGNENISREMLTGGAIGAGAGAALTSAASAIGSRVRAARTTPDEQAALIVSGNLAEDGMAVAGRGALPAGNLGPAQPEPAQIYGAGVAAAQRLGVPAPPVTLADLNPGGAVAGQLDSVLSAPTAGARVTRDELIARMDAQPDRVRNVFETVFEMPGGTAYEASRAARQAQQAAGPLFDQARAVGAIDDPLIHDLLPRLPNSILTNSAEIARLNGVDPTGLVRDGQLTRIPTAAELIEIRRGLSDAVSKAFRDQENERAIALRDALRTYTARLDTLMPTYGQGRALYADQAAIVRAMDEGRRRALTMDPAEIAYRVQDLSEPERDGFLRGAMNALTDRLGNVREGRDAAGVYGLRRNEQERLRALMDATVGTDAANQRMPDLLDVLRLEDQISQSSRRAYQQSPTAARAGSTVDRRQSDVVNNLAVGAGTGGTGAALGAAGALLTGNDPWTGAAIGAGAAGGAGMLNNVYRSVMARQAAERARQVDGTVLNLLGPSSAGGVRLQADQLARILQSRDAAIAGAGANPGLRTGLFGSISAQPFVGPGEQQGQQQGLFGNVGR